MKCQKGLTCNLSPEKQHTLPHCPAQPPTSLSSWVAERIVSPKQGVGKAPSLPLSLSLCTKCFESAAAERVCVICFGALPWQLLPVFIVKFSVLIVF